MKLKSLFILFALSAWMFVACDNNNHADNDDTDVTTQAGDTMPETPTTDEVTANSPSNETVDFMKEAASGGIMEVAVGNLAMKNSTNKMVKDMGQMLVTDHSKANEKLKAIASNMNVALPDSMMDKHKDKVDKLAKLKGKEFDKEFADMAVEDHQEDIDKFTKAADGMKDTTVLRWINENLPVLRKHLEHAQSMQKSMGK